MSNLASLRLIHNGKSKTTSNNGALTFVNKKINTSEMSKQSLTD